MVRPAQLEVHGVHIVLQGDQIEASPVKTIGKAPVDRRVLQPVVDVVEAGAFASEPCPAFIRRIEAAHSVEVGKLGRGEGVSEVEKCVHAPIVVESCSKSRNHSTIPTA